MRNSHCKCSKPLDTHLSLSNLSRIIIVRHAHALDRVEFARKHPNDLLRPLSKKGRVQCKKIARFVRDFLQDTPISHIVSSPAARTIQTTKPLRKILAHTPFVVCESIAPDCGREGYIKVLEQYADSQTLLLVGHQPDIGLFVEFLSGCGAITIKKGCVIELVRKPIAYARDALDSHRPHSTRTKDSHKLWQDTFRLNLLIDPKRL